MCPSVAERRVEVEKAAQSFSRFLQVGDNGAQLNSLQRWSVCAATKDALTCPGCSGLPVGTCLRPGTNAYQVLDELKHDKPSMSPNITISDDQLKAITTIVHAIVNHQGLIDESWHDSALSAIQSSGIIPDEDSTSSRYHSALVEIIMLTAITHGYNAALLMMGNSQGFELPPVDGKILRTVRPPRFDPASLLKQGKLLTRDDSIARSPFFIASQVNKRSPSFENLESEDQRLLLLMANAMLPYVCCPLAPQYGTQIIECGNVLYYDWDQPAFLLSFLPIKASKCAGVTRHDLETVASSLATAHACGF